MQIEIKPTNEIVTIDGVTCRRWQGSTEYGMFDLYVHRVRVDLENPELQQALEELGIREKPQPKEICEGDHECPF